MSDASHFLLKSATPALQISAEERQRRQEAVKFAWANVGLEGFTPSQHADESARRFVSGEIDLAEFVEIATISKASGGSGE